MFPGDPRHIHSPADLAEVGQQMKISAAPDSELDSYSKTLDEAQEIITGQSFTPEYIQYLRTSGGNRAIWLDSHLLSLAMTTDDYHGHQWHFSMCEITREGMQQPQSDHCKKVLDAFFSKWESVPNPGQMKMILHFVGND